MIDVNQLRRNVTFTHDGNLYKVTEYSHHKPGRGKATIRVNVRNLRTGANLLLTFNSSDRVQDIRLEKRPMQYLYDDTQFYVFMDTETYDQVFLAHAVVGDDAGYFKEGLILELLSYDGEIIDYNLPNNIDFDVIQADVAIAGDTASNLTKEVTIETGMRVRTPAFIKEGDVIRVDTRDGSYVTRV